LINVYLDDLRPCPRGFVPARTAEECLLLLAECDVRLLSLDYELGYGQPNGMAVVRGIIESDKYPAEIYIHSSSMSGRAAMARALREAAPAGVAVHDGPMPPDVLARAATSGASSDA
jgi:hypothetical protein